MKKVLFIVLALFMISEVNADETWIVQASRDNVAASNDAKTKTSEVGSAPSKDAKVTAKTEKGISADLTGAAKEAQTANWHAVLKTAKALRGQAGDLVETVQKMLPQEVADTAGELGRSMCSTAGDCDAGQCCCNVFGRHYCWSKAKCENGGYQCI